MVNARIEVYIKDRLQYSVPLDKNSISIGRSEKCDVILNDDSVSRRQAEIRGDHNQYEIIDRGGTNGTELKSAHGPYTRIQKPTVLRDGDLVRIGTFLLKVCLPSGNEWKDGTMMGELVTAEPPKVAPEPAGGQANVKPFSKPMTLRCTAGSMKGNTITLTEGPVTIGREPQGGHARIVVPDDGVSGKTHAVIQERNGKYYLADEKSRNGTYVEGVKISEATPLKHGMHFTVGATTFEVSLATGPIVAVASTLRPSVLVAFVGILVLVAAGVFHFATREQGPQNVSLLLRDVTVKEGQEGTRPAIFSVVLLDAVEGGFVLRYHTVDGTGTAGEDYEGQAGQIAMKGAKGEAHEIQVPVLGDKVPEKDETFSLHIEVAGGEDAKRIHLVNVGLIWATIENDDGAGAESVHVAPTPVEVKPVEVKPVEVKPVEVKPVEVKPVVPTPGVEPKPSFEFDPAREIKLDEPIEVLEVQP